MLGFSFNSSSDSSNDPSGVLGNLEGEISQIEGNVKGNISSAINGAINDVAKVLNIHDFYSVHMLDYVSSIFPNSSTHTLTLVPIVVRGMSMLDSSYSGSSFALRATMSLILWPILLSIRGRTLLDVPTGPRCSASMPQMFSKVN